MEDDLNIFENGRRPQFLKMEDDLNFLKMEDNLNFLKMEEALNFLKMKDDLIFLKMEDDLNFCLSKRKTHIAIYRFRQSKEP